MIEVPVWTKLQSPAYHVRTISLKILICKMWKYMSSSRIPTQASHFKSPKLHEPVSKCPLAVLSIYFSMSSKRDNQCFSRTTGLQFLWILFCWNTATQCISLWWSGSSRSACTMLTSTSWGKYWASFADYCSVVFYDSNVAPFSNMAIKISWWSPHF